MSGRAPLRGCRGAYTAAADARSDLRVNTHLVGGTQSNQLTLWVDKRSFLPLRTEVHDATEVVVDHSEVTKVEYNVLMPDSIFAYTPPAGVAIANFTGGDGADVKRLLATRRQPIRRHLARLRSFSRGTAFSRPSGFPRVPAGRLKVISALTGC
jgi:hypothetical protein